MSELGALLFSIAALLLATFARPPRAHCPAGWWVDGVRASGVYGCRPTPASDSDARTEVKDSTPDVELVGAVYCTGGTRPIVVDAHVVGCQMGGY